MVTLNSVSKRISLYGYQSETEYENVFAVLDIQTYIVYSWYIRDENISNNLRKHENQMPVAFSLHQIQTN